MGFLWLPGTELTWDLMMTHSTITGKIRPER